MEIELQLDYKLEVKSDISHLIQFISSLEQDCIEITQQDSDLKVGFFTGKLHTYLGTLKQRIWDLENNIDKI